MYFKIPQSQYPANLPGYQFDEDYIDFCFNRKGITITERFYALSFYGTNNQYAAYCSGVIDNKGKTYFSQAPASGFAKPQKIKFLSTLPPAYIQKPLT